MKRNIKLANPYNPVDLIVMDGTNGIFYCIIECNYIRTDFEKLVLNGSLYSIKIYKNVTFDKLESGYVKGDIWYGNIKIPYIKKWYNSNIWCSDSNIIRKLRIAQI